MQLEAAPKGKDRKAAQAELDKAEARLSKYKGRLSAMHSSETAPKVEVGCLEEVISRMEADADGEWGSVMFIPAGKLLQQAPNCIDMPKIPGSLFLHRRSSAMCLRPYLRECGICRRIGIPAAMRREARQYFEDRTVPPNYTDMTTDLR